MGDHWKSSSHSEYAWRRRPQISIERKTSEFDDEELDQGPRLDFTEYSSGSTWQTTSKSQFKEMCHKSNSISNVIPNPYKSSVNILPQNGETDTYRSHSREYFVKFGSKTVAKIKPQHQRSSIYFPDDETIRGRNVSTSHDAYRERRHVVEKVIPLQQHTEFPWRMASSFGDDTIRGDTSNRVNFKSGFGRKKAVEAALPPQSNSLFPNPSAHLDKVESTTKSAYRIKR